MNFMHLVGVIEIISGILINIFIGQLAKFIFRKDGTGPRIQSNYSKPQHIQKTQQAYLRRLPVVSLG